MKVILKGIFTFLLIGILLPFSLFLSNSTTYDIEGNLSIVERPPLEKQLLDQMSIEEKIGQLFMFGFSGTTSNENITELIQNIHIGGILILGPNIINQQQLATLTRELQSISAIPLLISIDQEGGIVSRLTGDIILTKAQKSMNTSEEAFSIAKERGILLKNLGVNVNLAPVVEYITSSNSFMYQRVFRGTIEDVATKSKSSIEGYRSSNIIPVAKHYPGHSNTSPDSHYSLPKVYITSQQWDEFIFPFKYLIEENVVDVIMVGHILYPKIDSKPSTVSSEIINTRLRGTLGYEGVVITDDMEMDSIESVGEHKQIAKEALLAGNDILLYSGMPKLQREVYEYILQSVKNGEISEEVINEKVLRVLKLKSNYELMDFSIVQPQE